MVFATLSWQQALGQAFTSDGLNYNVTSPTTCSVGNQNQAATGAVVIPTQVTYNSTIYSVTSISNNAFKDCSSLLSSVTIPNSVTSIGNSAFESCYGLISASIPNSVTSIGDYAFVNCSGLISATIPNSVTSIGVFAFGNCSVLTSVTIPNSVTSIGQQAFFNCIGLTSVTIPNSLTTIGNSTFAFCYGLTSVTIPNSVTRIGDAAFQFCVGLTSVTIPNSVTRIDGAAFQGCSGLTSLTIPNSVTIIGIHAFQDCSGLISLTIPNSVTSISDYTFTSCSGLISLTIPNSVTSIGYAAFGYCSGLTFVNIPNSVTTIGNSAFRNCSGLTSVIIPNSVTGIGSNAFAYCSGLISVSISNSLTYILDSAFFNCTGLSSVTIPSSISYIADNAFANCTGLTSVTCYKTFPLYISANVFQGVNQNACNLTVPNSSIGAYQGAAVWQNFMVSGLSNIPTTKVKANLCGTTLTSLNANINADYVVGYQQYRFEVTNGATVNTVAVNKYNFSLTQTPGITYGTTYGVRVAVKMGGTWGAYGVSCNVTTPTLTANVIPTTTIVPSLCGTTLASKDSKITAVMVTGATNGRYEITKAGSAPVVYEVASTVIKLAQTGVVVDYNTAYTIRVAAFVGGVWGNYGTSCTVTTPAAPGARLKAKSFKVSAYPNPFDTAFNLSLESPSKEDVTIAIYDMMGKLVETHQVNPTELANLQIGTNFAAGIYNVMVSQANEMQAIRLIRK